jgi:hypothetical protein
MHCDMSALSHAYLRRRQQAIAPLGLHRPPRGYGGCQKEVSAGVYARYRETGCGEAATDWERQATVLRAGLVHTRFREASCLLEPSASGGGGKRGRARVRCL